VPCKKKHTSVTFYVGTFDPIVDGHLLAVDSDEVQAQIAKACPSKVGDWVGGSLDARRLSRFKATWFSPTLAASESGADWFRCDLVAKRGDRSFETLTGTKGVLDDPAALDTYGTCSTTDPGDGTKPFETVACAEPHSWRAVSVVDIEKDAATWGRSPRRWATRRARRRPSSGRRTRWSSSGRSSGPARRRSTPASATGCAGCRTRPDPGS
jgi:hypothetical protein